MKTNGKIQLAPLARVVVPMMVGRTVADTLDLPVVWWLLPLILILLLAFFVSRRPITQTVLVLLAFFFLGGMLLSIQLQQNRPELPQQDFLFEGVIVNEPVEKNKVMVCDLIITNLSRPVKIKASFWKDRRSKSLQIGEGVRGVMRLDSLTNGQLYSHKGSTSSSFHRKSSFDYKKYLLRHNFVATTFLYSDSWRRQVVSLRSLSYIKRTRLAALIYRRKLLDIFRSHDILQHDFAVIAAMTLGDKSQLSQETKDLFSATGASHVLALSGLHLGIVYGLLSMLYRGRRYRWLFEIIVLIAIWSYTVMVGMSPSVVRSASMLTVYSVMGLLYRDKMSFNVISLAAIVMLIVSPSDLFDVGFQLSYTAVLAIILLYNPLCKLIPHFRFKLVDGLLKMLIVSLSAQIGTSPLVAYYFGIIPCYSILSSLVVIPAATIIIYVAMMMIVFSFWTAAGNLCAEILSGVVGFMSSALTWISNLPGATIVNIRLSCIQVWMIYVVFFSLYLMIRYIQLVGKKKKL